MKILLTFCVILLHHSLISCRTVPHSELDSPNEDLDSPTEEIANLLIPLIEKTLEKNNQRARKLIQMLPYNESVEASRWSSFNKKRVVEIMPLRRKQRRGEKPLAYLLAAPQSDTERRERRRGVKKHETGEIDIKHKEHEVEPTDSDNDDDSDNDSVETVSHDDTQSKGHVNAILKNHETREESNERSDISSGSGSRSGSGSDSGSSEEPDSRVEEALDYDDGDDTDGDDDDGDSDDYDDAVSGDNDNYNDNHAVYDKVDNLTEDENSSDKKELNNGVSENIKVSEVQESDSNSDSNDDEDDNVPKEIREASNDQNESDAKFSLNLREEGNLDHVHKSDESDQVSDDSDDSQYWGTKEVSFEGILDKSDDSNPNDDNTYESSEFDLNGSSNCKRSTRVRDSNTSEGDRRHEHKSYRLSFLFNR